MLHHATDATDLQQAFQASIFLVTRPQDVPSIDEFGAWLRIQDELVPTNLAFAQQSHDERLDSSSVNRVYQSKSDRNHRFAR